MNPTNVADADRPDGVVDPRDSERVLALFGSIATECAAILTSNDDWSMSGERATQYSIDVDIDAACIGALHAAGFAVLSEESGVTGPDGSPLGEAPDAVVVVDPLDGSTNAALGLPWCANAMCLVVDGVPTVAHVLNLRTGVAYAAVHGRGAMRNGAPITVADPVGLADAIVAVNARPPSTFRPRQFRGMGATALDVASVAGAGVGGGFDAYIDFDDDRIGVWDYLASVLIVEEAGGVVADALGRDLVTLDHAARRRPVAASNAALLAELLEA
ncbi:inositol monophosphatase family protein [Ilumatobacter coccineus]|uniref:Putative inositol monophosphatase n=1 Tax=Ilumatobacter coccineus (strain NBRC 103263 / KCTC 29153 / YM16-304) TaxID=1313172 RepID=A0A6C7E778_ILUCY|nr:inositol monophosphatase family protein [Ilumatobacter coccineus]BAN02597.1 putative inositol monophosphatase [Ilumatobacter coccineus YM16-304]